MTNIGLKLIHLWLWILLIAFVFYKAECDLNSKREYAEALVRFRSCAVENKLKAIHKKYSNAERGVVALLPSTKALLTVAAAPHS